jgi:hypothetical protein
MIYHYTDADGVLGIIESKAIWATNVWFMNDSVEATYGSKRVEKFLESINPASDEKQLAVRIAQGVIRNLRTSESFPESYITCFSKKGDQLSQWRAYGYGKGFSIGFDRDAIAALANHYSPNQAGGHIHEVIYGKSEQKRVLQSVFDQKVTAKSAQADADYDELIQEFISSAINVIPSLKNSAFKEEAEVRLHFYLSHADGRMLFRNSAVGITPYMRLPLCLPGEKSITAIREVIVGPQRHPAEAYRAVRQLLAKNGCPDADVRLSSVPLRS